MRAHGYQRLDPQEVKARELADNWVHVHKQWQEAIYGVEEELLIEEAQDIKKEARRRGLIERVNALLRNQRSHLCKLLEVKIKALDFQIDCQEDYGIMRVDIRRI